MTPFLYKYGNKLCVCVGGWGGGGGGVFRVTIVSSEQSAKALG